MAHVHFLLQYSLNKKAVPIKVLSLKIFKPLSRVRTPAKYILSMLILDGWELINGHPANNF